jgi:hypothetical protein
VVKLADTSSPPDTVLNQKRVMYYSAQWQLLEERIDDDVDAQEPNGVDRHMQYVWMAWSSPTRNDHVARRGSAAQYHGTRLGCRALFLLLGMTLCCAGACSNAPLRPDEIKPDARYGDIDATERHFARLEQRVSRAGERAAGHLQRIALEMEPADLHWLASFMAYLASGTLRSPEYLDVMDVILDRARHNREVHYSAALFYWRYELPVVCDRLLQLTMDTDLRAAGIGSVYARALGNLCAKSSASADNCDAAPLLPFILESMALEGHVAEDHERRAMYLLTLLRAAALCGGDAATCCEILNAIVAPHVAAAVNELVVEVHAVCCSE